MTSRLHRTASAFAILLEIVYPIAAPARENSVKSVGEFSDRMMGAVNDYAKNLPYESAADFSALGQRITIQDESAALSEDETDCPDGDEDSDKPGKKKKKKSKDERFVEKSKEAEPNGYKLLMILDVQSSGAGMDDQALPKFERFKADYRSQQKFREFQKIGMKYGTTRVGDREEAFTSALNSYVEELGLDPKNPAHFERFVQEFARLLDSKEYDTAKMVDDEATNFGAVDALTTQRGGVCVDYAMWIGELMSRAGVIGFDRKKNFEPTGYSTDGSAHTIGTIINPHTGEKHYINYTRILKTAKNSTVPIESLLQKEFSSPHEGITVRKGVGKTDAANNTVVPQGNELSGVSLTPMGKNLQDIAYSGTDGFQQNKIDAQTGVARTNRATLGASLQKNKIKSNGAESNRSWDIGVSYIEVDGVSERDKTQRVMVWGRRRVETEGKNADRRYQIFVGGMRGNSPETSYYVDMAGEYNPKVQFDLKFLDPDASLKIQGFSGMRMMGYMSTKKTTEDIEVRQDRRGMYVQEYTQDEGGAYVRGDRIADYDPVSQNMNNPDGEFDAKKNYIIVDPYTGEEWNWNDRNEIRPYYYREDGEKTVLAKTIDGNVRANLGTRMDLKLNNELTLYGQGMLAIAPSPKNLSTFRGDKQIMDPKSYYLATEKNVTVGANYAAPFAGGKVRADASYRRNTNDFGTRNFTNLRLDYVRREKDYFIYFNTSSFNEATGSAANSYKSAGVGYTGKIFKGAAGTATLGVTSYDQGPTLLQTGVKATIGGGNKKKRGPATRH